MVAYHSGPNEWRLPPRDAAGWLVWPALGAKWLLVPLLHFGYVGVHLFFVISGFCIHLRAARARRDPAARTLPVREFFLRRFWRIYPPYWIALGLFGIAVPVAAHALGQAAAGYTAGDLALHASMLHTFSERAIFSINPAFWSIATEEQFYLIYPLILPLLARAAAARRFSLVLGAALLVSLGVRGAFFLAVPATVEHFMTWRLLSAFFLPRWFEWLLGCALAEAVVNPDNPLARHRRLLAIAAPLLLALAMACRVHVLADKLFADSLFGAGFAALAGALLGGARADGSPGVIGRALTAVGRRAYGTYLIHQPILDGPWLPLPLRLVLAAAASALFSRFAERPFERRSQRVGSAPEIVKYSAA